MGGADLPEEEVLYLEDTVGSPLPCYVERAFAVEGKDYVLLQPVDYPVQIFAWEHLDDEELTLADVDDEELDLILPTAQAVLAEQNLALKRTAFTLTVEGDLPEDGEVFPIETEEDEEESGEEYQELAKFYHKEQGYSVFAPITPLLFIAQIQANGEPRLISQDELQRLQPVLSLLEAELEEEDEEEDL